MDSNTASGVSKIRGSLFVRRIGSAILATITAAYLAIITYSFSDRLQSTRNIVVFVLLVSLGLVALAVLSRPWRNLMRRDQGHPQNPK